MKNFGYTSYTVEEAKRKMERYCVFQERCHREILQKLQQMRMIPEAIDEIIVHLIEHDFLNEGRFSENFALGKFRQKNWGKLRIRRELKARGIGDYLIRQALLKISDSDYLSALKLLVEKKSLQFEMLTLEEKNRKLYHYLAYRGWESDLIMEQLRNAHWG
jgi:regulatory protein